MPIAIKNKKNIQIEVIWMSLTSYKHIIFKSLTCSFNCSTVYDQSLEHAVYCIILEIEVVTFNEFVKTICLARKRSIIEK